MTPRKFRITAFPVNAVHISLDLETAGLGPQSAIVQIGAYNVNTGGVFHSGVSLMSCERHGLEIDRETLDWWDRQDPELRKKVFGSNVELGEALTALSTWLVAQCEGDFERIALWGNGVDFDNAIIKHAYEKFYQWPVSHRNNHHLRTLTAMTPVAVLHQGHDHWEQTNATDDQLHDALSDAIYQGHLIEAALTHIGAL